MKVSVSLPADDLQFIDQYAKQQGASRSAVLHTAVRLLKSSGLADAYEAAWKEWETDGEEAVWASASADGLSG